MNELTKGNVIPINLSSKICHALGTIFLECHKEHQNVAMICGEVDEGGLDEKEERQTYKHQ